MEEKKYYFYVWHDYLELRGKGKDILGVHLDGKIINEAIQNHEWDKFRLYSFLLDGLEIYKGRNRNIKYLPYTVFCYEKDYKIVRLTKEIFMKINHSEYECG